MNEKREAQPVPQFCGLRRWESRRRASALGIRELTVLQCLEKHWPAQPSFSGASISAGGAHAFIQGDSSLSLSWEGWKGAAAPLVYRGTHREVVSCPGPQCPTAEQSCPPTPGRRCTALRSDPSLRTSQDLRFCSLDPIWGEAVGPFSGQQLCGLIDLHRDTLEPSECEPGGPGLLCTLPGTCHPQLTPLPDSWPEITGDLNTPGKWVPAHWLIADNSSSSAESKGLISVSSEAASNPVVGGLRAPPQGEPGN
ncbi:PREDICTED: uncharacterized protein LOC109372252 [Hipposideros armiger]|uniref:Uncharacterized protein LOC109372252 n=1 Tax=Hipposideros armiger TaxID=186990 RepID=A0A8B7PZX3_HIPAR|nr:PREDICTED: uncharacterized protein LOC109372252 [Hipposideros armiger]